MDCLEKTTKEINKMELSKKEEIEVGKIYKSKVCLISEPTYLLQLVI